MKHIALITASERPIPATHGGATQTMMTHLIDVNEEFGDNEFVIFCYHESEAEKESYHYKYSRFFFYSPNNVIDYVFSFYWRVLRKLTGERVFIRSRFIKWCADIIKKNDLDVVILEGGCFQVQQLRKLIPNKIILHMHIDRINKELKASAKMIKASDGLFAISEFCKKRMLEVVPSAGGKILVLKNTIDTELFCYKGDEVRNSYREKLGISKDKKVVSYCGRLDPTKGVLELFKAIHLLNDENIHLLIIGSSAYLGSKKNKYFSELESYSQALKGGVTFTGFISQKELPCYLSVSDLACVPSVCLEAAGNVTIEAMACELPVIASSQGGIPEYADTRACILVEYNDRFVEKMAQGIQKVLYDEKLYGSLKKEARTISKEFDKHNYYVNFCDSVEQIIEL